VLSIACDSALITSIVSKWQETEKLQGPSYESRVSGDYSHVVFGKKIPWWKRKCKWIAMS
jgi:hypothetical protein